MGDFSPNTNIMDARRLRAVLLGVAGGLLLVSFALLAESILRHKVFVEWDEVLKNSLHEHSRTHDMLRGFLHRFTRVAALPALVAEATVVLVVLMYLREWRLGAIWIVVTFGGFKFVDLLKDYYDRPRPDVIEPLLDESGRSLPSGHAAGSVLVFGLLAYLLIRFTRRAGFFLLPLLGLLILGIGFSRIYLGVHWLSDVVAGYVFGSATVALGMSAAEAVRER
jgi:undecaprenyl-diphosphatase